MQTFGMTKTFVLTSQGKVLMISYFNIKVCGGGSTNSQNTLESDATVYIG